MSLLVMVAIPYIKAQPLSADFSLSGDVRSWNDNQVGLHNTVLQNGERYDFTKRSFNSHAYYDRDSWIDIDITYSDQLFQHIPGLYNVEEDIVIIRNPLDGITPIKLTKELVSSFTIGDDNFIFIREEVGYRSQGYYKLLYDGSTMDLLGKVYKKLEVVSGSLTYVLNYDYFLRKDGDYHQIRRFSSIKRLFPNYKNQLRAFKRDLSLSGRYQEKSEQKLVSLIKYCSELIEE